MFTDLRKNLFLKDKIILTNLILSIICWLFSLVWLYFKIAPQVEPIALRYTIYFGIDLIGPWYYVYIFPSVGIIIILINFILAYYIFLKIKILSYFLVLTSTAIQILSIIISLLIFLLNK